MLRTTLSLAVLALLFCFSTGCSSLSSYRYSPASAETTWADRGADAPWVRTVAQLRGFEERDLGEQGEQDVVLARIRVENPGTETVQLVESEFTLLDGRLSAFGAPSAWLATGEAWSVAPGAAIVVELEFPLPVGDLEELDLDSLTLGWAIRRGVELHPTSTVFERSQRRPGYGRFANQFYDPYCDPFGYRPGWPYGFGLGFSHTY